MLLHQCRGDVIRECENGTLLKKNNSSRCLRLRRDSVREVYKYIAFIINNN